MSVKLTVVYDNPKDPEAFEKHYTSVHVPLVLAIAGATRVELAKVFPKEDGTPTPAYRTADIYFPDYKSAVEALGTPEGRKAAADAAQIATGGVRFLLSDIEHA